MKTRSAFSVTRKGLFIRNPTDGFATYGAGTLTKVDPDGLVSDLTFTISGGRFGATFTRSATVGTYTHASFVTMKILSL